MKYRSISEFDRDFKKLLKRFRTLVDDIEVAKQNAIELYHILEKDNLSVFQITGLGNEKVKFFKLKKFACKAMKGKGIQSGIRIIYAFYPDQMLVEFLQIYYKGDEENEDRDRIIYYLKENRLVEQGG
jgi:hypothetical protein